MDWNGVLNELLGFVGQRIAITLSVDDQPLTATIYGVLQAAPEVKAGDFYIYVDTGSSVRVREHSFTKATWVEGPLGPELAVGFRDILVNVKALPAG